MDGIFIVGVILCGVICCGSCSDGQRCVITFRRGDDQALAGVSLMTPWGVRVLDLPRRQGFTMVKHAG